MPTRRESLKVLVLGTGALVALPGLRAFGASDAEAQNATAAPSTLAPPGAATAANPVAPALAGPFTLPPLGYAFDALEPILDAQTMQIHHDKHHAAYVNNLNKAVAGKPDLARRTVEDLLRGLASLPDDVRPAVRNQGGGHANHSLLWPGLRKDCAHAPVGELGPALDKAFGSFPTFQEKFNAAAMSVFGSGWAWLTFDRAGGLALETSPNQDSPLSAGRVPLLGIDVWEHAYYLKFQNRRIEYVAAFAQVVDWDLVSSRYRDALKG